jgi:hypothetical protein
MAQKTNVTNSYTLPETVDAALKLFKDKLASGLGDNLQSITVVGSSLTDDFVPSQSDINTVLVLDKQTQASLNIIASLAKPMSKKKLSAPLLMTASYIERSRDVFGVELLDFQLIHKTILGDDPFASLSFDKKDVRLQCERELKAMLIRLRQGYIAAAANKKLVRDILISTSKSLTPLLRAMLWLKDAERPILTNRTLKKAAQEFSCNMDSVITVRGWRHEKVKPSQDRMQNTFEQNYSTVDKLAAIIDALEV